MKMQTTDTTCSYYDPCGGYDCEACNESIRVVFPWEREALEAERVLISLSNSVGPKVSLRTSEKVDGALSCVVDLAGTWPVLGQGRGPDLDTERLHLDGGSLIIASDNKDELSEKETSNPTPFRYVKEMKRKRRFNARERKEIRSSKPPCGVELVADKFDDTYNSSKEVPNRSDNKFSCLEDDDGKEKCRFSGRLLGKAKALVSFLSYDLGIQANAKLLPPVIECGRTRSAVRACFPSTLSCVEELSIKSVQKTERSYCQFCRDKLSRKLIEWKESLRSPVSIDGDHLERFRHALRSNIRKGWNSIPGPYIPNGSATLTGKVKEGGNWLRDEFSDLCRASIVISSGKPRVVTCYAEHNTRVLTPLHNSLYECLRRKGWLLVGDPTPDQVAGLNGDGPFLSFDYMGATDNIKRAYTEAAVEILIEMGEGLSADEVRCMRVLSNLRVARGSADEVALGLASGTLDVDDGFERGQPMGSSMSFPLLCLINKTVVDLSLTDLLTSGVISFKEWTQHRCLINGDDLLLKEPKEKSNLKDAITRNGSAVGLIVNQEKSGVAYEHAEINSTPFIVDPFSCPKVVEKQVKTNSNVLYMSPETEDVLGFAYSACRTVKGFVRAVKANVGLLSRQKDKMLWSLPYPYVAAIRKVKKIKKALMVAPLSSKDVLGNLFPMVEKPFDYDLSREEEISIMNREVDRVRNDAIELQRAKAMMKYCKTVKKEGSWGPHHFRVLEKPVLAPHGRSWRSMIKKRKVARELILLCLERAYREKQKRSLVEDDGRQPLYLEEVDYFHDRSLYSSEVEYLTNAIRGFNIPVRPVCKPQCIDMRFLVFSEVTVVPRLPITNESA